MADRWTDGRCRASQAQRAERAYLMDLRSAMRDRSNLYSQRVTARLKLDVAERFVHAPQIFFPHNLDFRGRAYAVGPHLQQVRR